MMRLLWAGAFFSVVFYLVAEWSAANGQPAPSSNTRSELRQPLGGTWSVAMGDASPRGVAPWDGGRGNALIREHD